MAIADLLVGLVVCPITAYWGWIISVRGESPFDLSVIFAINVFSVNVSFGHVFLLTLDRVFSLMTPLRYRVRGTNKRVLIANCACWIYFIAFGSAFLMLRDFFAIMGAVYNVQLLFILLSMLVMYVVILFRFHRYSKERVKCHSLRDCSIIMQRERKTLQGHLNCHLCISNLLHAVVHRSNVDLRLSSVPSAFTVTYDILRIFRKFNVRKLGFKPIFVCMATSKI